ncbi:hypothetical protein [Nocardioides marmorisolisilvae]|uniref:SGNH/GDSL hydrolase family protein n=1 Tax=Nocardioides marmorisolisilvae TaxID=1542737 RepID=A0A3N0DPY8_9ACTN|nr:hypothetical protein [Nocardioides marmorisolisilvae]RNL77506.1 hypothetical protein EFL95_15890 [Nocardioides marmorisolisilvae]
MSVPQPLPIRVLVKGASLTHDISARPQLREDFTFSRVIEEQLLAAGHGAVVWAPAVASSKTSHLFKNWEEQVKAWSPDVVITNAGYFEPLHLFLPRWLERHANSLKARPGPVRGLYRHYLLRPVWKSLARLQRQVDRRVGARFFGRTVRRAHADLVAYIDRTRLVGQPLVMVFEFLGPGARGRDWFPGMEARVEMMNVMIRQMVADYDDPEIVLVRLPDIVERHLPPGTEPNNDGFHFNPDVHRFIGEEIADEIRSWAKQYPRLAPRD